MKQVIREDLLEHLRYTREMKNVLNMCSFVDPRFKGNFAENLDDTVKACTDEALNLGCHDTTESPPAAEESTSSTTSASNTKSKVKSLSGLLEHISTAKKNRSTSSGKETQSISERTN